MSSSSSRWIIFEFTTLALACVLVNGSQYQLSPSFNQLAPKKPEFFESRVFFPLELNVPDLINGILSAFRYLWRRLQSILGYSGSSEIVGAKDPPRPSQQEVLPITPSPALQALPLAPEDELKSPVKLVSVEVDDPVRHPSMHKTKIRVKKRKKKRRKSQTAIFWELMAMEDGWI